MCIGTIQLQSLVAGVANPSGKFWDGVNTVGDNFDIIGGAICGSFVVFGILSVILYRPWRQRVDRRRRRATIEGSELQDIDNKTADEKGIITLDTGREVYPNN